MMSEVMTEYVKWAGVRGPNPWNLGGLNDRGMSFPDIADFIDRHM